MITYFMQLNVKLLFVLILFGFIMGQTRHAAIQNFSNKNRSYLILDFFNLVGTPVHEIGHLLFGLIFGYKIDQICLYRTTKNKIHSVCKRNTKYKVIQLEPYILPMHCRLRNIQSIRIEIYHCMKESRFV